MVIGTLAVDGWAVTSDTATRGLSIAAACLGIGIVVVFNVPLVISETILRVI